MKSSKKRWSTQLKKVDRALALVAKGRPMKAVCKALGLARSHVQDLRQRPDTWVDGRTQRMPLVDEVLVV